MKQCTKCKEWKDESNYIKNCKSKDGLATICKSCKKAYNEANMDKIIAYRKSRPNYDREYYLINRDIILEKKRKNRIEKANLSRDFEFVCYKKSQLNNNISSAINRALKGAKSERHWEDLVGYSIQDLHNYLESLFDENINWDNMGTYWEIDHIIPQCTFNITSAAECEDFKICWSLANLRPLEKSANRRRPRDGRDVPKELRNKILNQRRCNNAYNRYA